MSATDSLLRLSRLFAHAHGLELSAVSWRLFGDSKKLRAIEQGADLQTRRLESALGYLSNRWPSSVEWPADIARPQAAAKAAP